VYAFWLRAMLYHPTFARIITEKDRTILMHLQEISATLHDSGYGFDIVF
jgi:nucleosome assembly protein 1-like 1